MSLGNEIHRTTSGDVPHGRHRAAFTLLELIVVIAIIGTLASLVAPSVFRNASDAKITAARSQIEMLGIALDAFRLDVGAYPTDQEGLAALYAAPSGGGYLVGAWRGPYLRREVPRDLWNHVYRASVSSGAATYEILSFGRDGKADGEGEDADISSKSSGSGRCETDRAPSRWQEIAPEVRTLRRSGRPPPPWKQNGRQSGIRSAKEMRRVLRERRRT